MSGIEWRHAYRTESTLDLLQVAHDMIAPPAPPAPPVPLTRRARRQLLRQVRRPRMSR